MITFDPNSPEQDPNRDSLAPGHPITWQAITAGTVLDGTLYEVPTLGRDAPSGRL